MGHNAVHPEQVTTGHRAFLTRRRALRAAERHGWLAK
jgi:hypothetical protein